MRALDSKGYVKPTPIQEQTIPLLLDEKDVIGIAQTGTGKTAAFVVPILQKLQERTNGLRGKNPKALVLAPTRELAAQISESFEAYGKFLNFKHLAVYGGVSIGPQIRTLSHGVDILIATPGRLMDLMNQEETDFELDSIEVHNEKYLECELKDYDFGLKGYVDRYIIDHEKKEIVIIDLKTTAKGIEKFAETVDFYRYWMQAVIYNLLVVKNSNKDISNYKKSFKFAVIDNYDHVYVFDVQDETFNNWTKGFLDIISRAEYHYRERDYNLPYDFAKGNVIL